MAEFDGPGDAVELAQVGQPDDRLRVRFQVAQVHAEDAVRLLFLATITSTTGDRWRACRRHHAEWSS